MLTLIPLVVKLAPLVENVVVASGGIAADVKIGLGVITAVREVIAEVKAAKDPKSDGGTLITVTEGGHIALVFVERIASTTAPLIGVSGSADLLTYGEALAKKLLPVLFPHLTGQLYAPPPVAPPLATTAPPVRPT